MGRVVDDEISATIFAKNFAEDNINRNMLVSYLVDKGYIFDIKTITKKGLANGITYKYGEGRAKWPVYSKSIQTLVLNDIPYILEKYSNLSTYTKPSKLESNSSIPATDSPFESGILYKYLGLKEFVIIDTETTGLESDDEVIELSVVSMDGEELYHSHYYPEKEVGYGASRVNHLSKEKLKGSPKFSLLEWEKIKKAIGGKTIMGHNIPFDKRLIEQTMCRYNIDSSETDAIFAGMYDTKIIAKKWISNNSYSLNNITTLIGITREEQHDSTDDCRMTLEFINRLEDIIKIRKEYAFIKG